MSNNVVSLFPPSNPGAAPMYGDPMSAPSYLAGTAPETSYLSPSGAGAGPSPIAKGTGSANGRPDGSKIRIVPNAEDLRAAVQRTPAINLTPGNGATGLTGMGVGMPAASVYPSALGGFQPSGYGDIGEGAMGLSGSTMRWAKFGVIDGAVVALSIVAGFALDGLMVKKFGTPKGYAPVLGAVGGTAIANAIGAFPEGLSSSLGVLGGTLLAAAPTAIAMKMGKPLKGKTAMVVGGSTLAILALAFWQARKSA